jgi:hypothetical protein
LFAADETSSLLPFVEGFKANAEAGLLERRRAGFRRTMCASSGFAYRRSAPQSDAYRHSQAGMQRLRTEKPA